MASAEIVSNLKLITSGNVPTTSNLGNGELAFGLVGGVAKLYGNVNGTIVDFSNFVEALACDIHKDFSASENGKVCIGSIPVYDNNITIDISCTTANTYHGTLVIATQNYYIQSAVMYGDENNMLAPLVKIEHIEGIVTVYCAFPGYSKNQVHIKVTPKRGEVTRVLERVAEMPTTNLYNFTKALTFPVTSVNGKTGAVTLNKSDVGLGNVDNVKQFSASNFPAPSQISGSHFVGADAEKWAINVGTLPTYPGTNTGITWSSTGLGISQGITENSGIWFDGDGINMWSPCDRDAITYYDEDDGSKVFRVTSTGIVYRKDGKRALYEGEAGGGTPYVTTISSWSGSSGNYYKQITATTHGKGTYPSVHTYVQNGNLWEETYDSPAIDSSGNVTVYTNVAISIKVVIK